MRECRIMSLVMNYEKNDITNVKFGDSPLYQSTSNVIYAAFGIERIWSFTS